MKLKIKDRLTFTGSLIFGVVFAVAATLVYLLFYDSSEKLIMDQLGKTAKITGIFYLEEDELPKTEHRKVKEEFRERVSNLNVEVRVFDEQDGIAYGEESTDSAITAAMLNKIRQNGNAGFKVNKFYYYGIFYPDNQGDFVVMIKENQDFFHAQSRKVLGILILVFLGGIAAIVVLSKMLSNVAYKPINDIVNQVNAINSESLNRRIESTGTHDEVQRLTDTFNDLLSRLSQNFAMQKNFINYFSHEVRTPLTSISGNIQVFGGQNQSAREFEKTKNTVLEDIKRIEEIMNTLMVISGLKKENNPGGKYRLDELVWDTLELVPADMRKKNIEVNIDVSPDEQSILQVRGHKSQMQIAVLNIVENALKFSPGQSVEIKVIEESEQPVLLIKDYGIGIPARDIKRVEEPFFRAANTAAIKGSGMGLTVAALIFKHNKVDFDIRSVKNEYTQVKLTFSPVF